MASRSRKSSSQQHDTSQPTISEQLANSELKRKAAELITSPKRRRIEEDKHSSYSLISASNMYNFGSSKGAPVDLTTSPPPSPGARRISNATPLAMQDGLNTPKFGARKLVVKNMRKTARSDSQNYCARTTEQLEDALTAIFKHERPSLSNEELYRGVENVCKLGSASELANMLERRCKAHIASIAKGHLASIRRVECIIVLREVVSAWKMWERQVTTIRSIFFYLDRSYLLSSSSLSIYDSAVRNFRAYVFGDASLATKTVDGACQLLLQDRTQISPDPALFKDAIDSFHRLAVYTTEFAPRLLGTSQQYVASWADQECAEKKVPDYVAACNDLIAAEMARCDDFALDGTTRRDLLELLEHHLIVRKVDDLVDSDSVADILDADDLAGMASLYTLLERKQLHTKLKEPFSQWIDDTGTSIVFDEKGQDEMVIRLLQLKVKLDKTWRTSFNKSQDIGHALRQSFEIFINKSKKTSATWNTDNSKPGEMIAKYVDIILRGGRKAIPSQLSASVIKTPGLTKTTTMDEENEEPVGSDEDAEVDSQLEQVLDLFRFVHGKAVFEAFYKKDLARRLLMGRSASNDAEKSMLNRLKNECGSSFTHNLEQMFRDVELARDEISGYKDRLQQSERRQDIDLSVNILSAAAWPTYPDIPVVIPAQVQRAIQNFEQYYRMKHTGRKLTWKHALAHCQLRAKFPKGAKEIVVSSFQAIVLLLFNGLAPDEHLTYERIRVESGLPDAEVIRTMQSLACAKLRPLTKHPRGRDVNTTDTFTLNLDFHHERYRVKINAIQLKETPEENKETHERVAADRQYETQAAIVRIMKGRKEIGHAELIAETIAATRSRGVLQPGDIKGQVEKLIEKEYMERIDGNRYAYVA